MSYFGSPYYGGGSCSTPSVDASNPFSGIITSGFKNLHISMIEALIEEGACSVSCTLEQDGSKWLDCPNCIENTVMGRSSQTYQPGGPIPFDFGICPYCNGAGRIENVITENIYLAPIWDSKEWIQMAGPSAYAPDVVLQTISKIDTYDQLMRAKSLLADSAISSYGRQILMRSGDPEFCGLGASSFIVTMWKKVS